MRLLSHPKARGLPFTKLLSPSCNAKSASLSVPYQGHLRQQRECRTMFRKLGILEALCCACE